MFAGFIFLKYKSGKYYFITTVEEGSCVTAFCTLFFSLFVDSTRLSLGKIMPMIN